MKNSNAILSERAFIGAILNGDTRGIDHALTVDAFSDPFCRAAFAACLQLEQRGQTADLVTLCDVYPDLDAGVLTDLMQEAAPVAALVAQHAANVRTAQQRRQALRICAETANALQDSSTPLEEVVSKARADLDAVSAHADSGELENGVDVAVDFHTWIYSRQREAPITTGLSNIDAKLDGGLFGGRLYVIGARPGMGKTAMLTQICAHAVRQGRRALFISLEITARDIYTRMVACVSGVSTGKMKAQTYSHGDELAITDAYALIPGERFSISTRAVTVEAVRRVALKVRAAGGLDVILVDYLQQLSTERKTSSRTEEVGMISRALKLLSMELDVPIVAAAQLNRQPTIGGNRPPRVSELRESGTIEQDADVVLLLHNPHDRSQGDDEEARNDGARQLCIGKNRHGTTGITNLRFDGALMRFTQVESRYGEVRSDGRED